MKSNNSIFAAAAFLMWLVIWPDPGYAQETKPPAHPAPHIEWRLSVDSLAAERAERAASTVIRPEWTKADVLLGIRRPAPSERIRLTKDGSARFPVVNYAIRIAAEQACVQRVPNTQTARCNIATVNGIPVTRYPGINDGRPLVHPKPFVARP